MIKLIKNGISRIKYWIDYWDLKPSKDIVGIFVALILLAALFYLPSFDPSFSMTAEKFADVCNDNGYEMADDTESYFPQYITAAVASLDEDCTLKYVSCTKVCYAKFYMATDLNQIRLNGGGYERYVYNSEFQLTTITDVDRMTVAYRNGTELIIISGPTEDSEALNKIIKKARIPSV